LTEEGSSRGQDSSPAGRQAKGAAFSAVIQLGTLAAVFVYFATDIKHLIIAAFDGLRYRNIKHSPETLLAWSIAFGTIPIAVLGLSFKDFISMFPPKKCSFTATTFNIISVN